MKTNQITKLALVLAITIVLQVFGNAINPFVLGSLVNIVLIFAVLELGLASAILLSLLTPVVALLIGHQSMPILVPIIFIGNTILVLVWNFVKKEEVIEITKNFVKVLVVGIIAAALKAIFLFLTVVKIILPHVLLPKLPEMKQSVVEKALTFNMGILQISTAIIATVLAIAVLPPLLKAIKSK